MTVTLPLPFRSSRELARGNAMLDEPCVVLDVVGIDLEPELYADWRRRIEQVARLLDWPAPRFAPPAVAGIRCLCFTAPAHQLHTAREANEWALCAAIHQRDPMHWCALRESLRNAAAAAASECQRVVAEIDECRALERLRHLGIVEAQGAQTA